jgi:hypothetical protein
MLTNNTGFKHPGSQTDEQLLTTLSTIEDVLGVESFGHDYAERAKWLSQKQLIWDEIQRRKPEERFDAVFECMTDKESIIALEERFQRMQKFTNDLVGYVNKLEKRIEELEALTKTKAIGVAR